MSQNASPLILDVAALVDQPGRSKDVLLEAHVSGLEVGLGRVTDGGAIHTELLLEALVEGILVSGRVSGSFALECSRCLTAFETPFDVAVNEVYAYPDQPVFDEGFVVEEGAIDLEPMFRDEVLLAVPTNPLHSPECKGLCQQCGQDLNLADCGHRRDEIDARWTPLRDLGSL